MLLRLGAFLGADSLAAARARFAGRAAVVEGVALEGPDCSLGFVVFVVAFCTLKLAVADSSALLAGSACATGLPDGIALFDALSGRYAGGGVPSRTCEYPGRAF